ncbi:hypothetical protein HA402_011333 [Bradysia odoriphaga]|nr:hypothetical protein HA402_011333 [Bradysia odoriphaga]
MKISKLILCVVTAAIISSDAFAATNKVFCYFGSWAGGRSGNGAFSVENINPNLCTHIAYSFIGLNTDGSVKLLDSGTLFTRFINLKNSNPNVKLLIAMGGWNEGSSTYSAVAASTSKRATFVTSVYNFLNKYGFDGFDFDWEYPGLRGGVYADRANFITLLKELKEKFNGSKLLTAAVGATQSFHQSSYDVVQMNQYLDLINIMSYDYHGAYDGVTGQTSPLYASSVDTNAQLNQDASITAWINAGASPQKLLMGVALYGRTFTLSNVNNNKVGSPTSGPGAAGPYTLESGTLSHLEICEKLKSSGWTTVFDDKQKNPYSYNGNQWIGYDNTQSVQIKAEYAVARNLGGIMVWAIDYEDAKNVCGGGAFPLLQTINRVLSGSPESTTTPATTVSTTTTKAQVTTTKAPTTTRATTNAPTTTSPGEFVCTASGTFRDPADCSVYYYCGANWNGSYSKTRYECKYGLVYDELRSLCNYAWAVRC